MAEMAGMAEWQKEWQNGKMAEMDTYVLFMVHADTNNNDDDTLIFYSIETIYRFWQCVSGNNNIQAQLTDHLVCEWEQKYMDTTYIHNSMSIVVVGEN